MYICYTDANTLGRNLGCFMISTVVTYKKDEETEIDVISEFKIKRFDNISKAEEMALNLGKALVKRLELKECLFRADNQSVVEKNMDTLKIEHVARRNNRADTIVRKAKYSKQIDDFIKLENHIEDIEKELNKELIDKRNKVINMYNLALEKNEAYSEISDEVKGIIKNLDKKINKNIKKAQEIIECSINVLSEISNIDIYATEYLPSNLEEKNILDKISNIGIEKVASICDAIVG